MGKLSPFFVLIISYLTTNLDDESLRKLSIASDGLHKTCTYSLPTSQANFKQCLQTTVTSISNPAPSGAEDYSDTLNFNPLSGSLMSVFLFIKDDKPRPQGSFSRQT